MKSYIAILFIAALLISCAKPAMQDRDVDGPSAQAELQKKCNGAIDYKTLVASLPTSVAGYTASSEAEGSTATYQDPTDASQSWTYSTASVNLAKDDGNIDISIIDTCYVSYLSAGWFGYAQYEGTQGYLKKTTVKGYVGWEQFDKDSNTYSFHVLVKDRVFVSTQGNDGVSAGNVKSAAEAVDYDKIASAAN